MKKLHLGHMLVCLCVLAIGSVVGMATKEALASRNAAGTMSGISGPYVSGTTISSSVVNARLADIETEITDSLDRSGKGGMLAALRGIDGTNAAPAFSFTSETGTGLYRVGAGNLGLSVSGAKLVDWTTTTETMTIPGSVSTNAAQWYEASLADGNSVTEVIGKANAGGLAGLLTYTKNATAANSTFCLGVFGGSASTVCADGNNKATVAGTLAVTGASTLTGGATIGSTGTAISASYWGTTSWNPGTIGTLSNATTTVTLTGAAAGAPCSLALPTGFATLTLGTTGCIVTANTCTIFIGNPSAGGLSPTGGGAATFGCRVWNP